MAMIIDPIIPQTLRDNRRVIAENVATSLATKIWWRNVAYEAQSKSRKEILSFALENANIYDGGKEGGSKDFDESIYLSAESTNHVFQSAKELGEDEASDLDSHGISDAAKWIAEVTEVSILHPQREIAKAIRNNVKTYDGKTLFATDHPVSGVKGDTSSPTLSNALTGYPVNGTLDVAANNFGNAISYVTGTPQTPTGYSRNLTVSSVLVGPKLFPRICQLTGAQFLPAAAATGGGTQDYKPYLAALGGITPVLAPELGAGYAGGSDTRYYVVCEFRSEHAPFVYHNRQPFSIRSNFEQDAELARIDSLQWTFKGRNSVMPMHPFLIFRFE